MDKKGIVDRIKSEMANKGISQHKFGQLFDPPMSGQQVGQILRLRDSVSAQKLRQMLSPFGLTCEKTETINWTIKEK